MKLLVIPLAFAVGILAHRLLAPLGGLIPYLLMLILLLTFLRLRLEHLRIRRQHYLIFAAQLLLAALVYVLIHPFHPTLALAGFMICISPTAASAPAVVGMLGGNVEFATVSSVLGNIVLAAITPMLLTFFIAQPQAFDLHTFGVMLIRVLGIVIIPLFAAVLLQHLLPKLAGMLRTYPAVGFYLWTFVLTVVCARSTVYLRDNPQPAPFLFAIAALSLVLCVVHFWLGRRIGGREFALEAGQSLGQRNTLFSIWICLAILKSPLIALGPTLYIIWHNAMNALQLWRAHATAKSAASTDA